jgi:hypothetical protein
MEEALMKDPLTQIAAAGAVVWIIERIKRFIGNSALSEQFASYLNRTLAAVFAGIAAIGIHYQFDAGAGTLLISGLTLDSLVGAGLLWLKQFILQQMAWKGYKGVKS